MDGASQTQKREFGSHCGPATGINSELPDAYLNDVDAPNTSVATKENQVHRLMIFMYANGYNYTEIAQKTEYSIPYVSRILRQPWARARVQAEQRNMGLDELHKLLAPQATGAYMRLVTLGESAKSESVQADVNKYIVNRYLGMPTQPVETVGKAADEMTDDELKAALSKAMPKLGDSDRMPALDNDDPRVGPKARSIPPVGLVGYSNSSPGVDENAGAESYAPPGYI